MEERESEQMVSELIEVAKDQGKRIAKTKEKDREGGHLLLNDDPY